MSLSNGTSAELDAPAMPGWREFLPAVFARRFVYCLSAFLCAMSLWAANSKAGLEPTPQWTTSEQLKSKWGKVPLEELRAQAEKGDPEAQHYLAWRYTIGDGLPKDPTTAASWYRKAADQGFALAQNNLGALYANGQGVKKDTAEAMRWYQKAAAQGSPAAFYNLGRHAYAEALRNHKTNDYRRYFELAAESGDMQAAVSLGYSYVFAVKQGQGSDANLALHWLLLADRNGCPAACSHIGWLYMGGHGVPKDYQEALRWFEKGAAKNDPDSQLSLARYELIVHKDRPNLKLAREWMLKAADQNLAQAFCCLGQLNELKGINHAPEVKPDYAEAARYYRRAADAGHADAADRLQELMKEGKIAPAEDSTPRLR